MVCGQYNHNFKQQQKEDGLNKIDTCQWDEGITS